MKLIFILLTTLIFLFGCEKEKRHIPSGNCNAGDFDCGDGLECTEQLTLEGSRYGCTPSNTQTPPVNEYIPSAGQETPNSPSVMAGIMTEEESAEPTGGTAPMSDFTPAVEEDQPSTGSDSQFPDTGVDRAVAAECLELVGCFDQENCGQYMMEEEQVECSRMCMDRYSAAAQNAYINFANCVRANCVDAAGRFTDEQCIIDRCFNQADACNLLIRVEDPQ